jgi:hypothetical protein
MKTFVIVLFVSFNYAIISAQNQVHKKTVENFALQFNNNDFDGIYNTFSPTMQQSRTKTYFFNFFTNIKKHNGALLKMEILDYTENKVRTSRGTYDGNFESELSTIRITVDSRVKITGFYIKRKNLI